MVFAVVGGDGKPTGYDIDNSLRFDDAGSSFVQRTNGANTGEDNATLSFWFKLGNIKTANNGGTIMTDGGTSGNHIIQLYAQKIYIGSANFNIMFPNLIRDPSAWYHLFIAFDSSQGTNTNRVKAYLNGVLLTGATGFTDYPDQNENLALCVDGNTTRIGGRGNSGDESFDGYLAEFHFLDGTTKAHTDFGETNDNGVWIPKKYIGGSYGDNGFFLEFKQTGGSADASGLGADTSGEGHHFSGNNIVAATDITTDTPTNNFATFNSVDCASNITLTEGNTVATANTNHSAVRATIGFRNGKWYWEQKVVNVSGQPAVGILGAEAPLGNQINAVPSRLYRASDGDSGAKYTDGSESNYGDEYAQNDIIGVAVDMDNGAIYFSKNGTFQDSGDPTSGSNKTNAAFTDLLTATSEHWLPAVKLYDEGMSINFGNSSHSISSGNADANGHGNFEYAVPSGYFALCTKNLAEHG